MAARLQSSTEFLMILAAIAAFSVVVVAAYAHFGSDQKAIYDSIAALPSRIATNQSSGAVPQNISMYIVAPNVTYVNKSSFFYLVVDAPNGATDVKASVHVDGNAAFYPSYVNSTITDFGMDEFTLIPKFPGVETVEITASATSGTQFLQKNASVIVMALSGSGSVNTSSPETSLSGGIVIDAQEKINYAIPAQGPVSNITYWSHCTYHGWFSGGVLPEPDQCGSNTWGFDTGDSSCNQFMYNGDDRYYCFSTQPLGADAGGVGQQSGYVYNVTLRISNNSLQLQVNLSNIHPIGTLRSQNGGDYGYARVMGVYGPDVYPVPYLTYAVLSKQENAYPVSITRYAAYSSIYSQVTQLLNAYNSSGGADLGYLEGLLSQLDRNASMLVNASQLINTDCNLSSMGTVYSCGTNDLSYTVLVHLNSSQYSMLNETLYSGSSAIEVRG